MHIYFCLELINIIYPVLMSNPAEFHAQISIMHETLFVVTDYNGGSQANPLIDMLLLQTFAMLKKSIFRIEFKRRLSKTMSCILKPKTIEECPGLNNYAFSLLIHIKTECLNYLCHDLIRTCAALIKPITRVKANREV